MTNEEIQQIRDDTADVMRLGFYPAKFTQGDLAYLGGFTTTYLVRDNEATGDARPLWNWVGLLICAEVTRRNASTVEHPIEPDQPIFDARGWTGFEMAAAELCTGKIVTEPRSDPPRVREFFRAVHMAVLKNSAVRHRMHAKRGNT